MVRNLQISSKAPSGAQTRWCDFFDVKYVHYSDGTYQNQFKEEREYKERKSGEGKIKEGRGSVSEFKGISRICRECKERKNL